MQWISKSMCCKNRPNKKHAVQLMSHCFEFFSIYIICWSMLVGLCMFLELTMRVMLPCVSLLCLSTDLWRWHFFLLHFTPTVITIEFDDVLHEVLFFDVFAALFGFAFVCGIWVWVWYDGISWHVWLDWSHTQCVQHFPWPFIYRNQQQVPIFDSAGCQEYFRSPMVSCWQAHFW